MLNQTLRLLPKTNYIASRIIGCIVLLILIPFFNIAQNFDWAKSMGGGDHDTGFSVAVDHLGNVYTTGFYENSGDFDPSSTVTTLTGNGDYDVFIQKLDPFGNLEWAKSIGGPSFDCGYSIDVDDDQNVYVTGSFRNDSIDFDPGEDTLLINSNGGDDIFIMKLDVNGELIWVKTIGGNFRDVGESIKVFDGNIYVTGYFHESVDFDPGIDDYILTSSGNYDVFVLKLDTNGNFNWARKFGGTGYDIGFSVSADSNGYVYTTGAFNGTSDFDPGIGTFDLTSEGGDDVFISKLDINGDFVWAKGFHGSGNDAGRSLKVDSFGNIFISGYFHNTTDFNPGSNSNNLSSSGYSDVFVAKLDQFGDYVWAKKVGSNFGDISYGIDLDDSINVYITGFFRGIVDFDPSGGSYEITSTPTFGNTSSSDDAFVLKLNQDGEFIFAKAVGGYSGDKGRAIAVSGRGDISVTGEYSAVGDFDPGAAVENLTPIGFNDIFVLQLTCNSEGIDVVTACDSFTWIDGITYTSDNDLASFIIPNAAGCDSTVFLDLNILQKSSGTDTIIACDSFTWIDGNTYTSDNNTATFNIVDGAQNGCDSLVTLDLTILNSVTGTDVQIACDTYTWIDGNTYTTDNNTATFNIVGGAVNGCDSLVTLDLTILNSSTGTDTQTACDAYTWIDGNTYTESNNTATFNIAGGAANGCDSLVTLELTILNSATRIDTQTACDSYTWLDGNTYTASNNTATIIIAGGATNGCDSIEMLDLTILNSATGIDSQTACDTFTWIDGNTYTTDNNTATFNIVGGAANGCDSLVTLDLTINSVSDVTTSTNDVTITSNNNSATYVWLDCDNNFTPIIGEVGQSFTASENGNYAVQLTENGCVDSSDCVAITTVNVIENSLEDNFVIYPNPTFEVLNIEFENNQEELTVSLLSTNGQLVKKEIFNGSSLIKFEVEAPAGMYLLKISNNNGVAVMRIVKQ